MELNTRKTRVSELQTGQRQCRESLLDVPKPSPDFLGPGLRALELSLQKDLEVKNILEHFPEVPTQGCCLSGRTDSRCSIYSLASLIHVTYPSHYLHTYTEHEKWPMGWGDRTVDQMCALYAATPVQSLALYIVPKVPPGVILEHTARSQMCITGNPFFLLILDHPFLWKCF